MFLLKYTSLFSLSKNSKLKAKFLFENEATKSSKTVVSLGGNVDWVCLVGNIVVRDCIGSNFVLAENAVVGVTVVGNVAV